MNASLKKITMVALLATSLLASNVTIGRACPRKGRGGGGYRGAARIPLPLYGKINNASRRPERQAPLTREPVRPVARVESKPSEPSAVPATVQLPDLRFVDLRLVDEGDAALELGPTYRVVVINEGPADVAAPFQVTLTIAAEDARSADAVRATEEVASLAAGKTQAISFSLPYARNLVAGSERVRVQVDSQRDVPETDEANNVAEVSPGQVDRVDPQVSTALPAAPRAGDDLVLKGESLGETAGRVFVTLGGVKLEATVIDWLPSQITVKLPQAILEEPTAAKVSVQRADGAAAVAVAVEIHPASVAIKNVASR